MSGKSYLCWIDQDGKRKRSAAPMPTEMAELLAAQLRTLSHGRQNDRAIPEEEVETWMAQS